jgi:hypothetical protein
MSRQKGWGRVTAHPLLELAANGTIEKIVNGLAPNWGPFQQLGDVGTKVVDALMAGVVLFLTGRAVVGAVHMKIGSSQHDAMQVKSGQKELAGSLTALFVVASISALFVIVYKMGL